MNLIAARILLALGLIGSGAVVRAQLAAHSPFLPPAGSATAPTEGAPLEFGGYIDTPEGERLYRIKDPARKTSDWVRLNERNPTLEVLAKHYDETNETLTIEHQGRPLVLARREARIVSAGSAAQMMPMPLPAPMPNAVPAAVTNAVVVNPTQADEQRRLEAVAAEVARRRALREQATQQINQGGRPQPVAPQRVAPQRFQQVPGPAPQNYPRRVPRQQR